MSGKSSVLNEVDRLYNDRQQRAIELRSDDRKVVGYFCCYPPVEMLTALGLVPYRIQGDAHKPIIKADGFLETVCCSFIRSCFDLSLNGHYDFLDGLVVPHSCDTVQRIYDIWRRHSKLRFAHFLDVPHMVHPSSYVFFKNELVRLRTALEAFAGKPMSDAALQGAVEMHNRTRALLRQVYELRKRERPVISGSEVLKLIIVGMGLPVDEYNELLVRLIAELESRKNPGVNGRPRVLIYGSELDDIAFIELLEGAGADVVVDDLCTGTRSFWPDVPITADPTDGLAARYLGGINCPRTYRPQQRPRSIDLEHRLGHLKKFAADFRVDGLILYIIRFCDTHELEAPDVVEYFAELGIRVLHLEEEYRTANVGQIRTRVEAFLETIGGA